VCHYLVESRHTATVAKADRTGYSAKDPLEPPGLPSCNSAANRSPAREAYHKLSRGALEEWREAARSGEAGSGLGVWLCVNPAWFVGLENLWELLNGLGP
jgi:hypothetical protein